MPPELDTIVGGGTIPVAIFAFFYGLSWLIRKTSKNRQPESFELPETVAQRRDYRVFVQLYQVANGIVDRSGVVLTEDERAVLREARDTLMR